MSEMRPIYSLYSDEQPVPMGKGRFVCCDEGQIESTVYM